MRIGVAQDGSRMIGRHRALGDAQKAEAITGQSAGAAASVVSAGQAAGFLGTTGFVAAIPVAGAFIAAGAALAALFHIGRGCGAPCVEAATAQQVFDVASDDVQAVAQAGMISRSHALAALGWLQDQANAILVGDKHMAAGLKEVGQTISAAKSAIQGVSDAQEQPFDANAAEALFLKEGTHGWEKGSITSGNSMALQAIGSTIPQTPVRVLNQQESSSPTTGTIAGLSTGELLLLAAGGGFLLYQMGKK